jgi:hypothetical protein
VSDRAAPAEHGEGCGCQRCRAFEVGNQVAVKHGCYSVLQNRARAAEIREQLVGDAHFVAPADAAAFDVAANLLAHGERGLIVLGVAQREEIEGIERGEPLRQEQRQNLARLSQDVRGWLNSAMRALDSLGMTPASRARLANDLAAAAQDAAMAELAAEGRAIRERREMEAARV